MSELQQHRAAASSARIRSTKRLIREIRNAPPLTPEQRAQIITAAAQMRVADELSPRERGTVA